MGVFSQDNFWYRRGETRDPLDTLVLTATRQEENPEDKVFGGKFVYAVMYCDSNDGKWKVSGQASEVSRHNIPNPPDYYKYIDPPEKSEDLLKK